LALACLVALSSAAAAQSPATLPAFAFPIHELRLWPTHTVGNVPGTTVTGVPLMVPTPPGAAGTPSAETTNGVLIPVLEQLGLSKHQIAWYAPLTWNATREAAFDPEVTLYFSLNVQATTRVTVQLDDVAPDGTLSLIGVQTQLASVQNTLPYHLTFHPIGAGAHLGKGHSIRLLVSAEDVDVLTWLQYGSSDSPSNVVVSSRVLDSDHDGIPDDVDPCPNDADCNGNGVVDGDEIATTNGDTFYQYYYNYPAGGTTRPPTNPLPGSPGNAGTGSGAGPAGAAPPQYKRVELYAATGLLGAGTTQFFLMLLQRRNP
jgi:hypothetical protein